MKIKCHIFNGFICVCVCVSSVHLIGYNFSVLCGYVLSLIFHESENLSIFLLSRLGFRTCWFWWCFQHWDHSKVSYCSLFLFLFNLFFFGCCFCFVRYVYDVIMFCREGKVKLFGLSLIRQMLFFLLFTYLFLIIFFLHV